MGLETGTWVSDLVTTNPAVTDPESQGANHLQLIKSVLQNTFPLTAKAFPFPVVAKVSVNTTAVKGDFNKTFEVTTTGGNVTITLPTLASGDTGWCCSAVKATSDTNSMVVAPPTGTINGAASISTTAQYSSILIIWDGTAFVNLLPLGSLPPAGSITSAMLASSAVNSAAIAANAVTLAKLATQADQTVLANVSGGAAVPTAATLTSIIDEMIGSTQGTILYRGASAWSALAVGTNGQVLQTQGAAANPEWVNPDRILINTLTASGSSVTDTSSLTSAFSNYELEFLDVTASTVTDLNIQFHSGGSYQSTNYNQTAVGRTNGAVISLENLGATQIYLTGQTGSWLSAFSGTFRLRNPSGTVLNKLLYGTGGWFYSGPGLGVCTSSGVWTGGTGAVDGIKIFPTTGTFSSGSIRIWGLP
jgi:hypothetical protein